MIIFTNIKRRHVYIINSMWRPVYINYYWAAVFYNLANIFTVFSVFYNLANMFTVFSKRHLFKQ